ncbi:hypothetical protein [Sedimentitalea todarodis]|uniref:Transcriptional regulator n=1 Tax=Sedimentitalea todarodis TaxID=1631240 RepID=A0ABU3VFH9_9RHOB|nr:hypothetical protein [Sedimentitalea todarodis]MDU9004942.1 hypothetical protein [Sedimentitalea todarodis]
MTIPQLKAAILQAIGGQWLLSVLLATAANSKREIAILCYNENA